MIDTVAMFIGAVQLTTSLLLLHRAVPTFLNESKSLTLLAWLLAVVVGCFGVGNMFVERVEDFNNWCMLAGHAGIASYSIIWLVQVSRNCSCRWWITSRLFKEAGDC